MLSDSPVTAALPCSDLERAKGWYQDKLGLSSSTDDPGGAQYDCADGTRFVLFPSSGASDGSFTQVGFDVEDLEAEVAELKGRGVEFEEYEFTVNAIADMDGDKSAWFKDSEGNLIALFQPKA
jgi:catechol 2,3-dioxygenase-like lactoylglutathione lyase family enzyme